MISATELAAKAGAGPINIRRPVPPFTEEHEEFRAAVSRFVATERYPLAQEWEDARWFPNDVFARLGELGYLGLKFLRYPRSGGSGPRSRNSATWCRASAARRSSRSRSPSRIRDRTSLRSGRARKTRGGYLVNGAKTFITTEFALTPSSRRSGRPSKAGIGAFLPDRRPRAGRHLESMKKLGWHASDTARISFDDVFAPEENLLGYRQLPADPRGRRLHRRIRARARRPRCSTRSDRRRDGRDHERDPR